MAAPALTPGAAGPDPDVQGLVYAGYKALPATEHRLLAVADPHRAQRWLAGLVPAVTAGGDARRHRAVHVAFTAAGLCALGLSEEDLRGFARPFVEGMVTPHRSRILGDGDGSAPEWWTWGGPGAPVHVLVVVYAPDPAGVDAVGAELGLDEPQESGCRTVACIRGLAPEDGREHFGFADGISQPTLDFEGPAKPDAGEDHWSRVAAGEVLLGAVDNSGHKPPSPAVAAADDPGGLLLAGDRAGTRDLGRNGTYLVMRQLAQDVAAFNGWLAAHTADAAEAEALAARMVGRQRDGTPLVPAGPAGQNDFGFAATDPQGTACPFGAHVRRSNPRDGRREEGEAGDGDPVGTLTGTKRHRLLRRGRRYGPPYAAGEAPGAERGLVFVALNADIERQFEFVQHHWINSPTFARPGEVDPLIGANGGEGGGCFTVPDPFVRRRYDGLPRFVEVRGGEYFFLPGLAALRWLTSRPLPAPAVTVAGPAETTASGEDREPEGAGSRP
jgi:Dyp-type peroxidase family